jgi:hypothetical protein
METSTSLAGNNRHATVGLVVLHHAVFQREERPVAADADVLAWMKLGAALADDDRTGENGLTAETFNAQSLRFAGATVTGRTLTCFMRHDG